MEVTTNLLSGVKWSMQLMSGGTRIAVGIVNSDGRVLARMKAATGGAGRTRSRTVRMLQSAMADTRATMKSADLFMAEIRKIIASSCRLVPYQKTELAALASLAEDINLISVARVWYHRFGSHGGQSAN